MRLSEYLRRQGKGAKSKLARDSGLAYSTLHWLERGEIKNPRAATIRAIERATDGAVTMADLLGLDEPEDPPFVLRRTA